MYFGFWDAPYRADVRIFVMFSADPAGITAFIVAAKEGGAAVSTNDLRAQRILGSFALDLRSLFLQKCLHFSKGFTVNDRSMSIFNIVLCPLPMVSFLDEWESTGEGFLTEGVSDVLFICQKISDAEFCPVA